MFDLLRHLFDTSGFPARWYCGQWSDSLGWTHILSDTAIFGAYLAIPVVLTIFLVRRRNEVPFSSVFFLFAAFIAFCGTGHLIEAVIFWHPLYRFAGVIKVATAAVSWATVVALIRIMPRALSFRSPESLEDEVQQRMVELEHTRAELQALYDQSPDMYVSVSVPQGRVLRCNRRVVEITGRDADSIVGHPIVDLYDPECHDDVRGAWRELMRTGRVLNRRLFVARDDGSKVPVLLTIESVRDADGNIIETRSALRDITSEYRAETLFRTTVEASPSGMVVVDDAGKIVLINTTGARLFGYDAEDLIGEPVEILVPEVKREGHAELRSEYHRHPEARAMGSDRTLFARRKDGTSFPVEVGLSPIETEDGTLVLGAVVDRTEIERTLDDLRRSNEDLERFAYVASHDLQEPLRMVSSYVQLLQKNFAGELGERADVYIHYAVDGATRMQGMLRDLLELSRLGSEVLDQEDVALQEVVAEALDLVGIEHVSVSPLPVVQGHRDLLVRVFQNLFSNANKFAGERPPEVEVEATPWERDRGTTQWRISVRDAGIGFEAAHAERIFEMFHRLHGRGTYEGTGIGLAIVAKIVDRHGGRIWAESAPGQGAVFHLTLRGRPSKR